MPKPISAEKKIEWETKIRQQHESGLSINRWCRQNQVTLCSFKKRMHAKVKAIKAELKKRMHDPIQEVGRWLKSVVTGHYRYYGVPGNSKR